MQIPDERLRSLLDPPEAGPPARPGLREASVLAPWFSKDGQDFILFTLRAVDLSTHAGEVSFPGGLREENEDAVQCALRECEEEVGIPTAEVEILGALPPKQSLHGFMVRFFLGRIDAPRKLVLDRREVEEVFAIPVQDLAQKTRWEWRDLPPPPRARRMPFFVHEGRELWGLTALFTLALLERLELH